MSVQTKRLFLPEAKPSMWIISIGLLALMVAWLGSNGGLTIPASVSLPKISHTDSAQIQATLAKLPLSFIPSGDQTESGVGFLVNGAGYAIFLTPGEVAFSASQQVEDMRVVSSVVRLRFAGANPNPVLKGREQLPGVANFFLGNDPAMWRTNVPTYGAVTYQGLYPGIDLAYSGTEGYLKSAFVVAPGADPAMIRLVYSGAQSMGLRQDGALVLRTELGELVERAPVVYQNIGGQRAYIPGSYLLLGSGRVGFQVGRYDAAYPLVIDPELIYSTFLGGSGDELGDDIAVDVSGNAYVTGATLSSADFPVKNPHQGAFGGGLTDAFVAKLDTTDTGAASLVYSTYLGGNSFDQGGGIDVDAFGNAYVTGFTFSGDFPTQNPLQSTLVGVNGDAFVTKLDDMGALVYSTFLGGGDRDSGTDIALDALGNAYVTGTTSSSDFPTTMGSFQPNPGGGSTDAFVAKLNTTGSELLYSTYLGGSVTDSGSGIAVDGSGNAYVTGDTNSLGFPGFPTANAFQPIFGGGLNDAFVAKLNATGSTLLYASFLGGSDFDFATGIAVDGPGNAFVVGTTNSLDFPIANALQLSFGGGDFDAFVARLNTTGSALLYSTYLGGGSNDQGSGIAVYSSGNAYVTGSTASPNFPIANPLQPGLFGATDAFVAKLDSGGSTLLYSTYLGGGGADKGGGIAADGGNAYVVGTTASTNFPTVNALQSVFGGGGTPDGDSFVAKISDMTSPTAAGDDDRDDDNDDDEDDDRDDDDGDGDDDTDNKA